MNLVIVCLNILPVPPLDGSAAVVVAWRAFDVVFDPIFWTAANLIYPGAVYS